EDHVRAVTEETDKFFALVKMDNRTHAPPVCSFSWGSEEETASSFPGSKLPESIASQRRTKFVCVVESVRQRFTFFSREGVPLRDVAQTFYAPAFELEVRGSSAPRDIVRDILTVSYEDNLREIDTFSLTVNNWDADARRPKYVGYGTRPTEDPAQRLAAMFDP